MMSFTDKTTLRGEKRSKKNVFPHSKPPLQSSQSEKVLSPNKFHLDQQRMNSSLKVSTNSTSNFSKAGSVSTFPSSLVDENGENARIYPASCIHTARNRPLGLYVFNSDAEDEDCFQSEVFSVSTSDLSSISSNNARRSKKYKSQKKFFSQEKSLSKRKRHSSKKSQGYSQEGSSSPTPSDYTFGDTDSLAGSIIFGKQEVDKTFYKSYDELFLDEPTSNDVNYFLFPPCDKCIKVTSQYNGDVWRELRSNGGVIQISNVDVALHVSALSKQVNPTCQLCSGPVRKVFKKTAEEKPISPLLERRRSAGINSPRKIAIGRSTSSVRMVGPQLADYNCPAISDDLVDGRVVLGLEDPPDCTMITNNITKSSQPSAFFSQSVIIAGPAIRVDLIDFRCIEAGAVVQLQTNTVLNMDQSHSDILNDDMLHDSRQYFKLGNSGQSCKITCLQSCSFYGPYKELSCCYEYGNGMQVTLDTTSLISSETGKKGCQIHLIPVFTQTTDINSDVSLWKRMFRKTFQVAIYGPRYTRRKNMFCLSVSSGGFSPPVMRVQEEKLSHLNLRLLNCYNLTVYKIQGFNMSVLTAKSSKSSLHLETDLSDCVITEDEMKTESRINRCFSLEISSLSDLFQSSRNTLDRRFVVVLKGQKDKRRHKMKCKAPEISVMKYPRCLSPAVTKRLAQNEESSALATIESKLHDNPFNWLLAQNDAKVRLLAEQFNDFTREVNGVRLAYTLKSNNNKNSKSGNQDFCMLTYQTGEYLPILSQHRLAINLGSGKRDCWIAYSRHCVGLIRVNIVRLMEFSEFSRWNGVRISVSKLIEALIVPVQHLHSDLKHVREKLLKCVRDWSRFAAVLRFGQPFTSSFIEKESDVEVKQENIAFYLDKYIEFSTNGPKCRKLHHEVVRALLYTEQYDVACELVTDFCVITVSLELSTRWKQFASLLIGNSKDRDNALHSSSSTSYPHCLDQDSLPAYDFLCYWRKRFENNHKGALLGLYHAATSFLEPSNLTLHRLTQCVFLVRGTEALCQFDTRL